MSARLFIAAKIGPPDSRRPISFRGPKFINAHTHTDQRPAAGAARWLSWLLALSPKWRTHLSFHLGALNALKSAKQASQK